MPRLARIVAPGLPHHVTQRGNRRRPTFFNDNDDLLYQSLLAEHARTAGVAVWAWCLTPNQVHLILVPKTATALTDCLRETHRRYTGHINHRESWRGYLWQGRFASCVMDEAHLLAAARYVECNPVRAKLCATPRDWRWSSARSHLEDRADGLKPSGARCSTSSPTGPRSLPRTPARPPTSACAAASAPAGRSATPA